MGCSCQPFHNSDSCQHLASYARNQHTGKNITIMACTTNMAKNTLPDPKQKENKNYVKMNCHKKKEMQKDKKPKS